MVQNPYWAEWWRKHGVAERAWLAGNPGGNWIKSVEYAELDQRSPGAEAAARGDEDAAVHEEETCPTCQGHGDTDRLVASLDALRDVVIKGDLSELMAVAERWRRDSGAVDGETLYQRLAQIRKIVDTASQIVQGQLRRARATAAAQSA
ncbi:hypothetical protein BKG82_27780 [Mycobacteroides chelonae]|uniref:Uncharacterized protein n=1 Tax=Mycobacteroides chelonae TaxID=1774 RepID=A0A1S1LHY9_MYCCH|nr:hypothetical protein BKG82_27780 [Mycobacteroides chelonae]